MLGNSERRFKVENLITAILLVLAAAFVIFCLFVIGYWVIVPLAHVIEAIIDLVRSLILHLKVKWHL